MKNFILASTSTVHGSGYLEYLKNEIQSLFCEVEEIIFVPYARPDGMTHDAYTAIASKFFEQLNIKVKGLHTVDDPQQAISEAKGIFVGGGNTFLLVRDLHAQDLFPIIKKKVENGTPYLGTSAGSNIAGVNMKTTNDMPIVFTPNFETLNLIPFNINPHYLDPDPNSTHKGETRQTRLLEFLSQNDLIVLGIREGNYVRGHGERLTIEGRHSTRIFKPNHDPFEIDPGSNLYKLLD